MMNYNHPYYDRLIRESGYGKAKDLYAYYGEHGGSTPTSSAGWATGF